MFPVVIGNGRCTTSDCVIHGYQVPKGVSKYLVHAFAFLLKIVESKRCSTICN